MGQQIVPGIYVNVRDFSAYAPALATTSVGMVGTASKGPLDTPTLVTDEGNLVNLFGPPSASHPALLCAIRYLRAGKTLWFVRVATGAVFSTGALPCYATDKIEVSAVSKGTWGNLITIDVAQGTTGWKLTVRYDEEVVEVFNDLVIGTDNSADDNYIETRINGLSEYISVTDLDDTEWLDEAEGYALTAGADGAPADKADVIGTMSSGVATGLQTLRNPETLDLNVICAPGRWEASVVAALITVCEDYRADCMCLIDPPSGLSSTEVMQWHNGDLTGNADYLTSAINSKYAAVYYPWVEVYDGYSETNITIPPSGHAAYVWAKTDYDAETWYAPAGPRRGLLPDALDLGFTCEAGDRIILRNNLNAVNAIVKKARIGILIDDNLTCHRAYTALRDINVMRLVLYLVKVISTANAYMQWQPNDPDSWREAVNITEPLLRNVKARRGVYDYRVICDASTNPAVKIDQGIMTMRVLIQPTRAAAIFEVSLDILPTGADFSIVGA